MKTDLKTFLENLTSYFDIIFKDRKTRIIILCSVILLVVVGIVGCFAITSSAEEPPSPPQPNTGIFINEVHLYPGFVDFGFVNGAIYEGEYGLVQTSNGFKGYDTIIWAFSGDNKVLAFSLNGSIVHILTNSESCYFLWLTDFEPEDEFGYDSNDNLIWEISLRIPYNLLGYWENLGGWSCPAEYDSFYINGRILDSNWQPYGTTFSETYLGYNDYTPAADYVMFLGPRGPYSIDNQTAVYFHVESLSSDSTWYDNVLLSYLLQIGGSDFYEVPPGLNLIESGYYRIIDNPPLINEVFWLNINFTVPLFRDPNNLFTSIYFGPSTTNSQTEDIYYNYIENSVTYTHLAYERNLSHDSVFFVPEFRYIKIENDILIDNSQYRYFFNFFERTSDDTPFIDYESGFNDGFNQGVAESFIANFFEGIIKALDNLTIFYGFSFLTIIQTVLGFGVLLWILKLIAGG